MPLIVNEEEYEVIKKSKEQIEAEQASQARSQLVKKKRHGSVRTLIPVPKSESKTRGGKKSRRTERKNIWVDPELVGALPAVPSRQQRRQGRAR